MLVASAEIWWVTAVFALVTVFVVSFFRDPERSVPPDENTIVSPADGKVIKLERVREERLLKDEALLISIFMNVFNVHVNRAPADAKVLAVSYNPGKFFNASFDKASLLNEQNMILMESPTGGRFVVNQIAGLVARRIVCYLGEGSETARGERIGMIRFGSRLDVYLPLDSKPMVKLGDRVWAASSTLALWGESK